MLIGGIRGLLFATFCIATMHRAKSLLLSDAAFFTAAASSLTDQEKARGGLARRYSKFDLTSKSGDNDPVIAAAKDFLASACPELLAVLEAHGDQDGARDRLVKIGRNLNATLRYGQEVLERKERGEAALMDVWSPEEEEEVCNELGRKLKSDASLQRLVRECKDLAKVLASPVKVPTVRYGRTGIQMPIVTLGCMRFQQSWNRGGKPIKSAEQIEEDCQSNLVAILRHAIHCGVNHIETAQGYGCSELQIGMALKTLFDEGVCKREDLIIQTKGGISASTSKSDYKSSILQQIERLGVGYVDLFSVHGLNTDDHCEWLFDHGEKGNLIEAVRELKAEGKIRWIGFSTHAPSHAIKSAIETDAFDYLNLHYHFMGSYTASGDGDEVDAQLENIRLAQKHDMGVFVISPYDKGGRMYTPSHLTRELMLPEMEPMEYASSWLWNHEKHCQGGDPAPIHTIVCGAARSSDLDQPVMAALRYQTDEAQEEFAAVSRRIQERKDRVLGTDGWQETWRVGLPNYSQSQKHGLQIGNMVWLYIAIHVYGMLDFAKDRYATLVGNSEKWDAEKSFKENVFASPAFHWMPGCGYIPSHDYSSELSNVPEKNRARVLEAMEFVHEWCCPVNSKSMAKEAGADEKKEEEAETNVVPLEWQIAYDMRPWTAFPER